MIKFILKNTTITELSDNLAHAAMRILRREGEKFSQVDNIVYLKRKNALPIVLAF